MTKVEATLTDAIDRLYRMTMTDEPDRSLVTPQTDANMTFVDAFIPNLWEEGIFDPYRRVEMALLASMANLPGEYKYSISDPEDENDTFTISLTSLEPRSNSMAKKATKTEKKDKTPSPAVEEFEFDYKVGDHVVVDGKSWEGWDAEITKIDAAGKWIHIQATRGKSKYKGRTRPQKITGYFVAEEGGEA